MYSLAFRPWAVSSERRAQLASCTSRKSEDTHPFPPTALQRLHVRLQHVHGLGQARRLHVEEQDFGRLFRPSEAQPHSLDGGDGAAGVEGDGVGDEGVGTAGLEVQGRQDRRREVLQIVGDDDGGAGLQRGGHDVAVLLVRQDGDGAHHGRDVADAGLFKGCDHRLPGAGRALRRVQHALVREDGRDGGLGFIQNGLGPTETEELRLRKGQQQIPLQRPGESAGIDQGGEAVGEHRLQMLPIQFGEVRQGVAALGLARFLVGEQILGPDPAVAPDHGVGDVALLQQGDEKGARDVQYVRRLLRGQHLTDRDEGDGVALADVAQQFHEEAGQGRGQNDFGRLSGVIEDAEALVGVAGGVGGEDLAQVIGRRPFRGGRQPVADLFGEGWQSHG